MKKKKRMPIRKIALRVLAGAGIVGVTVLAPKMGKLMGALDRAAVNRSKLYRRTWQALLRLQEEGLVVIKGTRGNHQVTLTTKGAQAVEEMEFEEYEIPEQTFWDGKWRVLMFDLNEKRRSVRDRLRGLLQSAGFVRLQDSVWVYPYPCDEFLALVRAHLRSGVGELRSLTADALESDGPLRAHFKL